jgi:hypothetical protein
MCRNILILWDAKVAECCVLPKENEAGRKAHMLMLICSQTHTLAALKGIDKNYAADNIFIQIYHSICHKTRNKHRHSTLIWVCPLLLSQLLLCLSLSCHSDHSLRIPCYFIFTLKCKV